jgi:Zn-finger nucleic acid-binding protein
LEEECVNCPRDGAELRVETNHGIEVDHCPECNGRWLDHHELDRLEATVSSTEEERVATIEYAVRQSDLACPQCAQPMRTFNYRAYALELDACDEQHGFWLDAGEDGRVRDIIKERVQGLQRARNAEAGWGRFLDGLGGGGRGGSLWDRLFGGR